MAISKSVLGLKGMYRVSEDVSRLRTLVGKRKGAVIRYVRAMRRTVITFGPAFLGTRDLAIFEGSKSGG